MKILINKGDFLEGLQNVQKAVSSKTTLPILVGILLETLEDDKIKLSATDMEIGIEAIVNGEVIEKGSIVLPAKYLVEIIKKLGDNPIQINVDRQNNTADIHSGYFKMSIHGFSPEDFPTIPWINEGFSCTLEQPLLKEMIKQTSFAASHDETRPFLTGVLFSLEDNLRIVATDGHRMALRQANVAHLEEGAPKGVIIPSKAINEVSRVLSDEENTEVLVNIGQNQVSFELKKLRLITRLIEGQFPSYKQVVPQEYKTRVKLNREDLGDALERASLIVRGESNTVKIIIQRDKIVIASNTPQVGKSYEEVACLLEGEEIQIAFNFKYFLDVLKVLDSEEVTIDFTGSLSPGVIRAVGIDNYVYIIMPVRSH